MATNDNDVTRNVFVTKLMVLTLKAMSAIVWCDGLVVSAMLRMVMNMNADDYACGMSVPQSLFRKERNAGVFILE